MLADFPVSAAKTGMLFSTEIIQAVADAWREATAAKPIALVVDPELAGFDAASLSAALTAAGIEHTVEFYDAFHGFAVPDNVLQKMDWLVEGVIGRVG